LRDDLLIFHFVNCKSNRHLMIMNHIDEILVDTSVGIQFWME
jgi:hypothetical protein